MSRIAVILIAALAVAGALPSYVPGAAADQANETERDLEAIRESLEETVNASSAALNITEKILGGPDSIRVTEPGQ